MEKTVITLLGIFITAVLLAGCLGNEAQDNMLVDDITSATGEGKHNPTPLPQGGPGMHDRGNFTLEGNLSEINEELGLPDNATDEEIREAFMERGLGNRSMDGPGMRRPGYDDNNFDNEFMEDIE